jgi:predicted metalloendopeptidase
MGHQGFRVSPEALGTFTSLIEHQEEHLAAVQSKLASISVPSDAFGHLPSAQQLYRAYQEHATAERRNVDDLKEALEGVVHGLGMSAANYRTQEDELASSFRGGAR